MRPSIFVQVLSYILGTISLRKIVLSLLFCVMLLGWVLPPSAEIYRWQDHEGVIRYSNTPPDDNSLEIEVIPTQRIPLLEDENGVVYYLHVPDGTLPQNLVTEESHKHLNLPPEVLERLIQEVSQIPSPAAKEPSPDLTALTIRLTELERSLQQETANRQRWEQEYRQTQSHTKELEQQNDSLRLALTEIQTKFEHLQQTLEASQKQMAALQPPNQELGVIETQVAQLQTSVTDMSQNSKQAAEQVQARVNALYARLEHIETEMKALPQPTMTEHVSALSQRVAELETQGMLPIQEVQTQLELLETQLNTMETQKMPIQEIQTRLASLETTLASFENRQEPEAELQAKLAALETNIETLRERIPASQRSHEIVEKLLDNGNILKSVVTRQSEQLDTQKAQVARLEQEIVRLKTIQEPPIPVKIVSKLPSQAADDELADLLEKQRTMESTIKHQTDALAEQTKRLEAFEAMIIQMQHKGMSAISRLNDEILLLFEEPSSGRVLVVPRKERRTEQEITLFDILGKSLR